MNPSHENSDKKLIDQVKRDEGSVKNAFGLHMPYRCTAGRLTIGYGHNLDANPLNGIGERSVISEADATRILEEDVRKAKEQVVRAFPWAASLDFPRFAVLVNMAFNMGIRGLYSFTNTLSAIQSGAYEDAARRMLASKWASQTRDRARRLARQMETGRWQ